MINDNDLLLLASSQNNKTFEVYIDSSGRKTLTPQTRNYTAKYVKPFVCFHHPSGTGGEGLLVDEKPKKVIFPNCSEITANPDGDGAFKAAFYDCTSLTSVSFPVLTTATGGHYDGAFAVAFEGCTSLTSVSFPSLTTATGGGVSGAFVNAFYVCTSLTSVSFPVLTTATGGEEKEGAFRLAFGLCTSLTSVSFPSLTTATGGGRYGAFYKAFYNCTSLTSVSFPSLTSVRSDCFDLAFENCSPSLKVHFKKSMKGTAGLDYITMSLTSADQVVFDLP